MTMIGRSRPAPDARIGFGAPRPPGRGPGRPGGRRPRWRTLLFWLAVFSPTIASAAYLAAFATGRYVSEAVFVVRAANKPAAAGLGGLLSLIGLGRAQEDAQTVAAYIRSRDAVRELAAAMPLAAMYGPPGADWVARYPNIVFPATDEGLHWYFQTRMTARVDELTGLTTLRIEAFQPEEARRVALALIEAAERMVNRLNKRAEEDSIGRAKDDLGVAEARLADAQVAMTAFRNRALMLTGTSSAAALAEVLAKLSTELARARAQIAESAQNAAAAPQLGALRAREQALMAQIREERAKIGPGEEALAEKIAEYERLDLEREFAGAAVTSALANLELARADARRQHVFLERVVEPGAADEATVPRRVAGALTVLGFNAIGFGLAWLLYAGFAGHKQVS
jgi:capsular polysaccharide transport system permease protein